MKGQSWILVMALSAVSPIAPTAACSHSGDGPDLVYHPNDFLYLTPDPKMIKNGSLFGYQAAFQSLSSGFVRVLVGAPLASLNGAAFTCPLVVDASAEGSNVTCAEINIDMKVIRRTENLSYSHHHTWLGASLTAKGDIFTVCAPRYSRRMNANKTHGPQEVDSYNVFGRCYEVNSMDQATQLKPVSKADVCRIPCKAIKTLHGSQGGLGWSQGTLNGHQYIGGPAVCTTGVFFGGPTRTITTGLQHFETACPRSVRENIVYPTINFGYAIASGTFLQKKRNDLAVSSLYGRHGYGMILIMKVTQESAVAATTIKDKQLGSMFGAALCAVRVHKQNQLQYEDLLVGAPSYATSSDQPEVGAVWLYLGGPSLSKHPEPSAILHGEKGTYRSYFGVSIVKLGDVDGDGYDEFAVGAPYEEGWGAVYIFGGPVEERRPRSEGPPPALRYRQRLAPKLKGFGASFAPILADVDRNGCNELAVGATDDELVAVLRCPARVRIRAQPRGAPIYTLNPWNEAVNATSFRIPSCVSVEPLGSFENINSGGVRVTTTLGADSGVTLDPNSQVYTIKFPLDQNGLQCKDIIATVDPKKEAETTDYRMDVQLISGECFSGKYERTCIVLAKGSKLNTDDDEIELLTRFGCDDTCNPILSSELQSIGNITEIEAGAMESLKVRLHVNNAGGSAYKWCVRLEVKGVTSVPPPGFRCKSSADVTVDNDDVISHDANYTCKPWVLFNNSQTDLDVTLVAQTLSSEHSATHVQVVSAVYIDCNTNNSRLIDSRYLTLPVYAKPQYVTIESVNIDPKKEIDQSEVSFDSVLSSNFSHVYKIRNAGPTTWKNVELQISARHYGFLQLGAPQSEEIVPCPKPEGETPQEQKQSENLTFIMNICFAPIISDHSFRVTLPLILLHIKIGASLNKPANVSTTAILMHPLFDEADSGKVARSSTRVSTIASARGVAWWIVLLATLAALAVLGTLVYIMFKKGFFKRKMKQNLKELKRKSLLMQSQRASAAAYDGYAPEPAPPGFELWVAPGPAPPAAASDDAHTH